LDLKKEIEQMTLSEVPGEPEVVTDLTQDEGLPTERADVPPISRGDLAPLQEGDGAEPQNVGGRHESDISFLFKLPGMLVGMRNRSTADSATNRAMAASLPIAVALAGAITFADLFPDAMSNPMAILIILLVVVLGFYVGLRVITEPAKGKSRRGKNTKAKGKDIGD